MKNIPIPLRVLALLAAGLLCTHHANAQNIWVGISGVSATTNWSDALNWSLGAAPVGEGVIFQDTGAVAVGVVNNVVDGSFAGSAGSLQYANTNGSHTTLIPAGVTLTVGGTLTAGTETDNGNTQQSTNTVTGAGTLNQTAGDLIVRQTTAAANNSQRATLDMSGLNTYTANIVLLRVGKQLASTTHTRGTGTLRLAKTNTITITGGSPGFEVGNNTTGPGGPCYIYLGQTNAVFSANVNIGRRKTTGNLLFGTGLVNPAAYFRGADGMSRVSAWNVGDNSEETGTTGSAATGVADFTGGTVDAQVTLMRVGRSKNGGTSGAGHGTGTLTFSAGLIDIDSLDLGYQGASSFSSGIGTVNVNGTATLVVNTSFSMGFTSGGTGVAGTRGVLNINGGTVRVPSITTGVGSANNTVAINGGSLVVTNTAGPGINTFAMTNGALTIPASVAGPTVVVTNVALGGAANTVNIAAIPAVPGYPAQFALIQYAGTLSGTFNIGVGTLPASSPAYAGFISNNVFNKSIDLVLTAGKLPARALAWSGATDGNWDTTTLNWLFSGSPTTYNEEDYVRFDDAATGPTALNLTAPRQPTSVTVSNQTKAYTFGGPGNLTGATGITKDGAAKLTIANSGVNDNTGGLTIEAGTVQVGDGSFSGNLGPGNIANNGALIFARADVVTVADTISGTGSLTQNGSGTLALNAANTYQGLTTVSQGTLQVGAAIVGNAAPLGTTNGGTTVASGATLDFNGRNIGLEPVTVSGGGVGDAGALVNNSGTEVYPAVAFVTMTGNTVFGGTTRWDLRSASTGNPNQSSLLTGGQPYKLTKVGANQVGIVGTTVDPALGDVEIQGGILGLEAAMTGLGNSQSNLTVWPGAQLKFYNVTNRLDKKIYLGSDGSFASLRSDSGNNTIVGSITMTNDCIFTFDGGTSLTLEGPLSGGLLTKIDTGTLIIAGAATHAGTYVSAGKLVLNGTHSGGITNPAASFAGSGTNMGFSDVTGALFPGDTNVVGTLTLSGLLLQPGAGVFLDLGPTTTVGGSANDLIQVNGDLTVNGNSLTINPQGLLLKGAGNPYTVIKYTGNLIENGPLTATGPYNYIFTVDTSVAKEIRLVVSGGPPVWNGGSATTSNWSDPANWGGISVVYGDSLYFGGSARLNNINDTTADTLYNNLGFVAGAGAFTLNGNSINLGGSIVNDSVNPQTVNLNLSLSTANAFSGTSGTLVIGGNVTNTVNLATLTLGGTGILSNRLASAGAVTNTLILNSTNANWTLRDNPSSTAVTNPTQLDIQAGTFNFGQGASAPVLASTTAGGLNARLGAIGGEPAIFNMGNGTLVIAARFNLGAAGNAIATLNHGGGLISVEDVFQGSDGSATAVSTINVSGGTLSVGEAETSPNTFFLCSRGAGTLNLSSSGLVRCGTFDVSRNASAAGSTGVVNLNGGTLNATRVGTGTSSFGAGGTPTATFNFNGGTLKARASSTTYFQGRTEVPITAIVKSGGAIIDSDTNAISVLEPLQHDGALGGTPDGGLTKLGSGTLALTAVNTYTGPTLVNNGTLLVSGSLAATPVTVASGGSLAGMGSIGGTATVNAGGTVAPGTATGIGTLTVANAVLNGSTFIKLNKSATPATNDVLAAASISLGGTLDATNAGPMLISGDSFTVFSGPLSGSIAPGTLPPLWPGLAWDTTQLNSAGRISVAGTMIPPEISGGISGTNFVLTGSGGVVGATYRVLTSQNVAAPLASWIPVATNVFDASGNLSINIGVNPSVPMLFYRVQVP